jgi:hypothetical protein
MTIDPFFQLNHRILRERFGIDACTRHESLIMLGLSSRYARQIMKQTNLGIVTDNGVVWIQQGYTKRVVHDGEKNIFVLEDALGTELVRSTSSYAISVIADPLIQKAEYLSLEVSRDNK